MYVCLNMHTHAHYHRSMSPGGRSPGVPTTASTPSPRTSPFYRRNRTPPRAVDTASIQSVPSLSHSQTHAKDHMNGVRMPGSAVPYISEHENAQSAPRHDTSSKQEIHRGSTTWMTTGWEGHGLGRGTGTAFSDHRTSVSTALGYDHASATRSKDGPPSDFAKADYRSGAPNMHASSTSGTPKVTTSSPPAFLRSSHSGHKGSTDNAHAYVDTHSHGTTSSPPAFLRSSYSGHKGSTDNAHGYDDTHSHGTSGRPPRARSASPRAFLADYTNNKENSPGRPRVKLENSPGRLRVKLEKGKSSLESSVNSSGGKRGTSGAKNRGGSGSDSDVVGFRGHVGDVHEQRHVGDMHEQRHVGHVHEQRHVQQTSRKRVQLDDSDVLSSDGMGAEAQTATVTVPRRHQHHHHHDSGFSAVHAGFLDQSDDAVKSSSEYVDDGDGDAVRQTGARRPVVKRDDVNVWMDEVRDDYVAN
jgi:hypothetical protein